jgi:hypothetical protein
VEGGRCGWRGWGEAGSDGVVNMGSLGHAGGLLLVSCLLHPVFGGKIGFETAFNQRSEPL